MPEPTATRSATPNRTATPRPVATTRVVQSPLLRGRAAGKEAAPAPFRSPTLARLLGAFGKATPGVSHPRPKKDRKSTRLNSSHLVISYAVFCLKKKNN